MIINQTFYTRIFFFRSKLPLFRPQLRCDLNLHPKNTYMFFILEDKEQHISWRN